METVVEVPLGTNYSNFILRNRDKRKHFRPMEKQKDCFSEIRLAVFFFGGWAGGWGESHPSTFPLSPPNMLCCTGGKGKPDENETCGNLMAKMRMRPLGSSYLVADWGGREGGREGSEGKCPAIFWDPQGF